MSYRFYYLDKAGKVVDLGVADYSDEAEAVAVAELHLANTPYHAIEVWRRGRIIYREAKGQPAQEASSA